MAQNYTNCKRRNSACEIIGKISYLYFKILVKYRKVSITTHIEDEKNVKAGK